MARSLRAASLLAIACATGCTLFDSLSGLTGGAGTSPQDGSAGDVVTAGPEGGAAEAGADVTTHEGGAESGTDGGSQGGTDGGTESGNEAGTGCTPGPCPPSVLASGQGGPWAVAVDATDVYWTVWGTAAANYADGAIRRCPLAGCPANGPITVTNDAHEPDQLVLDGTNVYFTNNGDASVRSCPLSGCASSTVIASGQTAPRGLALVGSTLYWSVEGPAAVMTSSTQGGTVSTVMSGLGQPWGVALSGGSVYVAGLSAGEILSCPAAGCGASTPSVFVSNQAPLYLAADATNVYWTNYATGNGSVAWCPLGGCPSTGPHYYVQSIYDPRGIATDATNVYFTIEGSGAGAGTVMSCPLAGCPASPVPLATGQATPRGIAVDANAVYWTDFGTSGNADGAVMKIAR